MIEIYNLTPEDRKRRMDALIDKMMNSGIENVKRNTKWKNREFVQGVLQDYLHYLLVERNGMLNKLTEKGIITESEAFSHLERTYNFRSKPNLDKAKKIMDTLDSCFEKGDSNYILKKHGKICDDSLDNLTSKLAVIMQYQYEEAIVVSPQKLRGSASWIKTRFAYYTEMIRLGKETRPLQQIPASELLSDKDRFTDMEGKKISDTRKKQLSERYNGEEGEEK